MQFKLWLESPIVVRKQKEWDSLPFIDVQFPNGDRWRYSFPSDATMDWYWRKYHRNVGRLVARLKSDPSIKPQLVENWFPLRITDKIHDQDSKPQLTPDGDYIVYHGTNMANARKIFKEKRIIHDDMGAVGITTHPTRADIYGSMKIRVGNKRIPSVVLRLVIDKNWLDKQEISREVGGSGKDQFLIRTNEIPSEAIKDIQVARVWGTPLKGGSLEYPKPSDEQNPPSV